MYGHRRSAPGPPRVTRRCLLLSGSSGSALSTAERELRLRAVYYCAAELRRRPACAHGELITRHCATTQARHYSATGARVLSGAPRPAPHQRPNTGLRYTRRSAERRASRLAPSGGSDGAIRTSHGRAALGPRRRTVQSHSRVLEHAAAPFAITYDMQLLLARPSDGWRSGTALSRPRDRMQRPPGQQSVPSSYTEISLGDSERQATTTSRANAL